MCMRNLDFGIIETSGEEKDFCKLLNRSTISLCYGLPASLRTEAVLFLYKYSESRLSEGFDFLRRYYSPCYSILYWINETAQSLPWDNPWLALLVESHASALLLHSLDDHLSDGSLRTTHTLLQLRTEAWSRYAQSSKLFAKEVHDGVLIAEEFVDRYFRTINDRSVLENLDEHLNRFRSQMATWSLQPYLLSRSFLSKDQAESVLKMYESFGISWRLLDDYQDLGEDLENSEKSSMIYFLPEEKREEWGPEKKAETLEYFRENHLNKHVSGLVNSYLESAAKIAQDLHLINYANSIRSLRIEETED
ncbi:hypothetical protein EHQ61_19595 [Leptospira wolffii]|nr:hypothetical protein EHQ61_19595 [Leptospira wolffii]